MLTKVSTYLAAATTHLFHLLVKTSFLSAVMFRSFASCVFRRTRISRIISGNFKWREKLDGHLAEDAHPINLVVLFQFCKGIDDSNVVLGLSPNVIDHCLGHLITGHSLAFIENLN